MMPGPTQPALNASLHTACPDGRAPPHCLLDADLHTACTTHHLAEGDQRDIRPRPHDLGLADGQQEVLI